MCARVFILTLLFSSVWGEAQSGGTTIDQWKARFLLLNAQGAQAKFVQEFDSKDSSPFGFLAVFHKGRLVEVCNIFHLAHETRGNMAVTAGHCTTKVPLAEAVFLLTYYDSRTDLQVVVEIQDPKPMPYPSDPTVPADLSYFPVAREITNRWDAIAYRPSADRSEGKSEGKDEFALWGYQFRERNDPRFPEDRSKLHPRAMMRKRSAKGTYRKGPQIAAELMDEKGEIAFGLRFGLSLSDRGFEADQKEALFLENCDWEPGDSGGLVTNGHHHPVAVVVTGENALTFSNRWDDTLKKDFFDKAAKELGKAPAEKSPIAFWFLGNHAKPVAFQLKEDRKFYAVALLLDAFLAD